LGSLGRREHLKEEVQNNVLLLLSEGNIEVQNGGGKKRVPTFKGDIETSLLIRA